ncbi:type II toxin-antitoxin system RelE/ParE family toxin [Pseudomonas lactis]|uniref:Type II toxin-antitoxin system RelE/ParE family toxin n=1 Tax=Pseudomonas lactis TaxID=1615674 RepID=A0A219A1E1_9PSED|nr:MULTISPECIES: type II toxin-antitoxin system RelE/ParE family toxin [Pseudomonas]MBD8558779.1 type II toxin-antitoxin system RelE/ParE family toxin [Pseudomonas fluorescens]MDI3251904.1 type II toxin-antitoxin system RelE/ParE family toxin [Pseudomonas sp. AL10]MDI3267862.1 type II toxin-antitoxin system RelE/ParE family toxin [Pseudomonas sp. AL15]NNA43719.1 type II toxin-antitoxin system RelE/ParE family toxin [Pseudomonas lactis]OWQ39318.1 plasmid stabilization protein [Pseudomonas lacti
MSYSVVFSPEVLAQLDALEDYISDVGSPPVAARFIDNLVSYCESLALFPLRGVRRDDLLKDLRITHYRRSTIIAFRVRPDFKTVSIVGMFYGGQDYTAWLHAGENEHPTRTEKPAEN